jgi:hypothetical protein
MLFRPPRLLPRQALARRRRLLRSDRRKSSVRGGTCAAKRAARASGKPAGTWLLASPPMSLAVSTPSRLLRTHQRPSLGQREAYAPGLDPGTSGGPSCRKRKSASVDPHFGGCLFTASSLMSAPPAGNSTYPFAALAGSSNLTSRELSTSRTASSPEQHRDVSRLSNRTNSSD